jgi:hypothetical protein
MVVGLIGKAASKGASKLGGSFLGSSTGRAAAAGGAAGLGGGMLVDDVPLVGSTLDPTEGGGNQQGGSGVNMTLVLIAVIALGFAWVLGGGN